MSDFEINLTGKEFSELNKKFPLAQKNTSSVVGKRAEKLIQMYFLKIDNKAIFEVLNDGGDLLIKSKRKEIKIEIKGTSQKSLNMNNIKVTGQKSHDILKSGLPLYRVTGVFDKKPKVYILKHGVNYTLEAEKRWVARPIKKS